MKDILIVIISQFAFCYFRTMNVWYTANDRVIGAMVTGLMVNVLWITTTFYGITALQARDWVTAGAYLIGGQLGVLWGMKRKWLQEKINHYWSYILYHAYFARIAFEIDYKLTTHSHKYEWRGHDRLIPKFWSERSAREVFIHELSLELSGYKS